MSTIINITDIKNQLELANFYFSDNRDIVTIGELRELSDKDITRFALFCAYQTMDNWRNFDNCMNGIEVVEMYIEDKVTSAYCEKATDAFFKNYERSDCVVFYALATTHFCQYSNYIPNSENAYYAGKFAFNLPPIHKTKYDFAKAQRDYYNELRYIDNIFERIVLEGNV